MRRGILRGRSHGTEQAEGNEPVRESATPTATRTDASPVARTAPAGYDTPMAGAPTPTAAEPAAFGDDRSGITATSRDRATRIPPAGTQARSGEAPGRSRTRWGRRARARDAGAATVGAVGSGVVALARLVMTIAGLIAVLIALAIVLRDVDANSANTIVKGIHEGANFFAGSFTGLITFAGHPKRAITIDWGIALIVYLIVGAVLAGWIGAIGRRGMGFGRRHRTLPSH